MARTTKTFTGLRLQPLSKKKRDILLDLARIGAATPTQFEVKTGRISQPVRISLQELTDEGLVERSTYSGGIENEVYRVSSKGRQLIRAQGWHKQLAQGDRLARAGKDISSFLPRK